MSAAPPIPQYHELMWPLVEVLKELGGSGTLSELDQRVIERGNFSEDQQAVLHKDGPQTEIEYRLAWARTHLKGIGATENSIRGVWALTEHGRELTRDQMANETKAWRAEIAERRRRRQEEEAADQDDAGAEDGWKDVLLRTLLAMAPAAFERLAQRLLREAGFVNVAVSGRAGDGGIDGVGVYRLSLVSFPTYFQCKRYAGSVSPSVVRDFRGAMAGRGDKGLLITTGKFTRDAVQEATRDGAPPIELIDGERLCELLKAYELGVTTKQRIEEDVTVEGAFFDDV